MKTLTSLLLLALTASVHAIEPPSEDEIEGATQETLDVGEEPLELEEIIVTGERFTLEQETALRMVRQALTERKSYKREDKDKWVCWYRKPGGTHFTYLECARNGDLQALRPDPMFGSLTTGGAGYAGYGTIYRSQRPVNKKKFESMLDTLPGSGDLDREFVAMTLAGSQPPRDIPSETELDDFAKAYGAVTQLDTAGAGEQELAAAIEDAGLTISRYNRIVDLVETYQSLENEVAFRLGTLDRPSD